MSAYRTPAGEPWPCRSTHRPDEPGGETYVMCGRCGHESIQLTTEQRAERETIARVVALVHREIRERDALGHIDAVQAFCSLCEQLKNGEWKGEP